MVITGDKVLRMYNRSLDYFPKKDQYKTVISSNRLIKKFSKIPSDKKYWMDFLSDGILGYFL